ncbi:MAG: winged helix-turn-helix domain-containing protein [Erythrobacter sp.]
MIYRFGTFTFDSGRFELTDSAGKSVHLQPRTKELLHLFLETGSGRLLTKSEIVAKLWDGRHISNAALLSQIKGLRQALNDTDRSRRVIETVHAKGWRLIPEIMTSFRDPALAPAQPEIPQVSTLDQPAGRIGQRPIIAVLPFRINGSLRNPNAGIAHALPDDIIAALSRLRLLKVIARGTSFQFGGDLTSASTLRAALGTDYVLDGRVDLTGPKVVI